MPPIGTGESLKSKPAAPRFPFLRRDNPNVFPEGDNELKEKDGHVAY